MGWRDIVVIVTAIMTTFCFIEALRRWLKETPPRPNPFKWMIRKVRVGYPFLGGIILAIVAIVFAFLPPSGPPPIKLGPIDLSYYEVCNNDFKGHVKAENLKPETLYAFCINGKAGSSGNDILKGKTGTTPNGEGYWDFYEWMSDSNGSLDIDFHTSVLQRLPEGQYDAKFLIKEGEKGKSIAAFDSLQFEIRYDAQDQSYKTVPMKIL
jgi:hypothetical protein